MKNSLEEEVIYKLQEDLPLVPEPYKLVAEELGISEKELLNTIRDLHSRKVLKRISAILQHRRVGIEANAMVVWCIPEEKIESAVEKMVKYTEVTHCYERKVLENWNYNIYTMIHSETKSHCDEIILSISKEIKIDNYEVLYSSKELKKSSMKYLL